MATITESQPTLESGDRLTREEFHRRYCARPDIKKAELVKGVVYVASPTRFTVHAEQHGIMAAWLALYALKTPGVRMGDAATVFMGDDSEVQPDVCLFREPPAGGLRFTEKGYLAGAPELVVEVAASSASYDLHDKLEVYRRTGVLEYLVWRVLDGAFDWFRLQGEAYVRIEPDDNGVIESMSVPGLRLNVQRLLAGDFRAAIGGS